MSAAGRTRTSAVQGNGCVAADLNGDGHTDLLLTTNTYNVLLWNNRDGTFTDGTHAAGIDAFGTYGWHPARPSRTSTATAGPTSSSQGTPT